jgi:hypothetical protein
MPSLWTAGSRPSSSRSGGPPDASCPERGGGIQATCPGPSATGNLRRLLDMNGVTLIHESTRVAWSDTAAWLNRRDHYAEPHPACVHIDGKDGTIYDITADEARRLALVPVDLADKLEAG